MKYYGLLISLLFISLSLSTSNREFPSLEQCCRESLSKFLKNNSLTLAQLSQKSFPEVVQEQLESEVVYPFLITVLHPDIKKNDHPISSLRNFTRWFYGKLPNKSDKKLDLLLQGVSDFFYKKYCYHLLFDYPFNSFFNALEIKNIIPGQKQIDTIIDEERKNYKAFKQALINCLRFKASPLEADFLKIYEKEGWYEKKSVTDLGVYIPYADDPFYIAFKYLKNREDVGRIIDLFMHFRLNPLKRMYHLSSRDRNDELSRSWCFKNIVEIIKEEARHLSDYSVIYYFENCFKKIN